MAGSACQRELNRQLQALQSRIKNLEDQVDSLHETTYTNIGQTAAAFAALIEEMIVTGLPTYIANQLILKIASAVLQQDMSQFPGMGAASSLVADISGMASAVKSLIMELITSLQLGAEFWQLFNIELMIPNLTVPPFLASLISQALAAAQTLVDAAQAALDADPSNVALQQALAAAIIQRDNTQAAAESVNRIAECKTISGLFVP